jgi:hypothetical protein
MDPYQSAKDLYSFAVDRTFGKQIGSILNRYCTLGMAVTVLQVKFPKVQLAYASRSSKKQAPLHEA